MDTLMSVLLLVCLMLWIVTGAFCMYASIRDDVRRERERKENKYYDETA